MRVQLLSGLSGIFMLLWVSSCSGQSQRDRPLTLTETFNLDNDSAFPDVNTMGQDGTTTSGQLMVGENSSSSNSSSINHNNNQQPPLAGGISPDTDVNKSRDHGVRNFQPAPTAQQINNDSDHVATKPRFSESDQVGTETTKSPAKADIHSSPEHVLELSPTQEQDPIMNTPQYLRASGDVHIVFSETQSEKRTPKYQFQQMWQSPKPEPSAPASRQLVTDNVFSNQENPGDQVTKALISPDQSSGDRNVQRFQLPDAKIIPGADSLKYLNPMQLMLKHHDPSIPISQEKLVREVADDQKYLLFNPKLKLELDTPSSRYQQKTFVAVKTTPQHQTADQLAVVEAQPTPLEKAPDYGQITRFEATRIPGQAPPQGYRSSSQSHQPPILASQYQQTPDLTDGRSSVFEPTSVAPDRNTLSLQDTNQPETEPVWGGTDRYQPDWTTENNDHYLVNLENSNQQGTRRGSERIFQLWNDVGKTDSNTWIDNNQNIGRYNSVLNANQQRPDHSDDRTVPLWDNTGELTDRSTNKGSQPQFNQFLYRAPQALLSPHESTVHSTNPGSPRNYYGQNAYQRSPGQYRHQQNTSPENNPAVSFRQIPAQFTLNGLNNVLPSRAGVPTSVQNPSVAFSSSTTNRNSRLSNLVGPIDRKLMPFPMDAKTFKELFPFHNRFHDRSENSVNSDVDYFSPHNFRPTPGIFSYNIRPLDKQLRPFPMDVNTYEEFFPFDARLYNSRSVPPRASPVLFTQFRGRSLGFAPQGDQNVDNKPCYHREIERYNIFLRNTNSDLSPSGVEPSGKPRTRDTERPILPYGNSNQHFPLPFEFRIHGPPISPESEKTFARRFFLPSRNSLTTDENLKQISQVHSNLRPPNSNLYSMLFNQFINTQLQNPETAADGYLNYSPNSEDFEHKSTSGRRRFFPNPTVYSASVTVPSLLGKPPRNVGNSQLTPSIDQEKPSRDSDSDAIQLKSIDLQNRGEQFPQQRLFPHTTMTKLTRKETPYADHSQQDQQTRYKPVSQPKLPTAIVWNNVAAASGPQPVRYPNPAWLFPYEPQRNRNGDSKTPTHEPHQNGRILFPYEPENYLDSNSATFHPPNNQDKRPLYPYEPENNPDRGASTLETPSDQIQRPLFPYEPENNPDRGTSTSETPYNQNQRPLFPYEPENHRKESSSFLPERGTTSPYEPINNMNKHVKLHQTSRQRPTSSLVQVQRPLYPYEAEHNTDGEKQQSHIVQNHGLSGGYRDRYLKSPSSLKTQEQRKLFPYDSENNIGRNLQPIVSSIKQSQRPLFPYEPDNKKARMSSNYLQNSDQQGSYIDRNIKSAPFQNQRQRSLFPYEPENSNWNVQTVSQQNQNPRSLFPYEPENNKDKHQRASVFTRNPANQGLYRDTYLTASSSQQSRGQRTLFPYEPENSANRVFGPSLSQQKQNQRSLFPYEPQNNRQQMTSTSSEKQQNSYVDSYLNSANIQSSQLLFPYQPENSFNTHVETTAPKQNNDQRMLIPYEPENNQNKNIRTSVSNQSPNHQGSYMDRFLKSTASPRHEQRRPLFPYEPENNQNKNRRTSVQSPNRQGSYMDRFLKSTVSPRHEQRKPLFPYEPENNQNKNRRTSVQSPKRQGSYMDRFLKSTASPHHEHRRPLFPYEPENVQSDTKKWLKEQQNSVKLMNQQPLFPYEPENNRNSERTKQTSFQNQNQRGSYVQRYLKTSTSSQVTGQTSLFPYGPENHAVRARPPIPQQKPSFFPRQSISTRHDRQKTVSPHIQSQSGRYRDRYLKSTASQQSQEKRPLFPYEPENNPSPNQQSYQRELFPYEPENNSDRSMEPATHQQTQRQRPLFPYEPGYNSDRNEEMTHEQRPLFPYEPENNPDRMAQARTNQQTQDHKRELFPYEPENARVMNGKSDQKPSPYSALRRPVPAPYPDSPVLNALLDNGHKIKNDFGMAVTKFSSRAASREHNPRQTTGFLAKRVEDLIKRPFKLSDLLSFNGRPLINALQSPKEPYQSKESARHRQGPPQATPWQPPVKIPFRNSNKAASELYDLIENQREESPDTRADDFTGSGQDTEAHNYETSDIIGTREETDLSNEMTDLHPSEQKNTFPLIPGSSPHNPPFSDSSQDAPSKMSKEENTRESQHNGVKDIRETSAFPHKLLQLQKFNIINNVLHQEGGLDKSTNFYEEKTRNLKDQTAATLNDARGKKVKKTLQVLPWGFIRPEPKPDYHRYYSSNAWSDPNFQSHNTPWRQVRTSLVSNLSPLHSQRSSPSNFVEGETEVVNQPQAEKQVGHQTEKKELSTHSGTSVRHLEINNNNTGKDKNNNSADSNYDLADTNMTSSTLAAHIFDPRNDSNSADNADDANTTTPGHNTTSDDKGMVRDSIIAPNDTTNENNITSTISPVTGNPSPNSGQENDSKVKKQDNKSKNLKASHLSNIENFLQAKGGNLTTHTDSSWASMELISSNFSDENALTGDGLPDNGTHIDVNRLDMPEEAATGELLNHTDRQPALVSTAAPNKVHSKRLTRSTREINWDDKNPVVRISGYTDGKMDAKSSGTLKSDAFTDRSRTGINASPDLTSTRNSAYAPSKQTHISSAGRQNSFRQIPPPSNSKLPFWDSGRARQDDVVPTGQVWSPQVNKKSWLNEMIDPSTIQYIPQTNNNINLDDSQNSRVMSYADRFLLDKKLRSSQQDLKHGTNNPLTATRSSQPPTQNRNYISSRSNIIPLSQTRAPTNPYGESILTPEGYYDPQTGGYFVDQVLNATQTTTNESSRLSYPSYYQSYTQRRNVNENDPLIYSSRDKSNLPTIANPRNINSNSYDNRTLDQKVISNNYETNVNDNVNNLRNPNSNIEGTNRNEKLRPPNPQSVEYVLLNSRNSSQSEKTSMNLVYNNPDGRRTSTISDHENDKRPDVRSAPRFTPPLSLTRGHPQYKTAVPNSGLNPPRTASPRASNDALNSHNGDSSQSYVQSKVPYTTTKSDRATSPVYGVKIPNYELPPGRSNANYGAQFYNSRVEGNAPVYSSNHKSISNVPPVVTSQSLPVPSQYTDLNQEYKLPSTRADTTFYPPKPAPVYNIQHPQNNSPYTNNNQGYALSPISTSKIGYFPYLIASPLAYMFNPRMMSPGFQRQLKRFMQRGKGLGTNPGNGGTLSYVPRPNGAHRYNLKTRFYRPDDGRFRRSLNYGNDLDEDTQAVLQYIYANKKFDSMNTKGFAHDYNAGNYHMQSDYQMKNYHPMEIKRYNNHRHVSNDHRNMVNIHQTGNNGDVGHGNQARHNHDMGRIHMGFYNTKRNDYGASGHMTDNMVNAHYKGSGNYMNNYKPSNFINTKLGGTKRRKTSRSLNRNRPGDAMDDAAVEHYLYTHHKFKKDESDDLLGDLLNFD